MYMRYGRGRLTDFWIASLQVASPIFRKDFREAIQDFQGVRIMTRTEQFRKSRAWLKIHTFAITNSLRGKLEAVPKEMRPGLCFVQNLVLTFADQYEEQAARIPSDCWKEKLGTAYKRFIQQLKDWNELEVDEEDFRWSKDKSGRPMPYAVPPSALESGTCLVDFEKQRIRLPRPKNKPKGPVSEYALECLSQLEVAETLVYPPPEDPSKNADIRKARIKNHCEHIFAGDFSLSYGRNVRRLGHRVLWMPKEGRCNLRYRGAAIAEYDVRTCHPLLMLSFFTNAIERAKYAEMLAGDIYSRVGQEMKIDDRRRVKEDFQRVVNFSHKTADWMAKQYVFQFYHRHFPTFAEQVLFQRNDLAPCLQNFEALLMVERLGAFCREKELFWIPMHDGFIARMDQGDAISGQASKIIQEAVGLAPQITRKPIISHYSMPFRSIAL